MNHIMGEIDLDGTHSCVLATLLAKTTGPILELGSGHYSTPLIHHMCSSRFCLSVGNESKQFKYYCEKIGSRFHYFYPVGKELVSSILSAKLDSFEFGNICWDVVFIDHFPVEDRVKCVEMLRNKAKYIICHDTEPLVSTEYNWNNIWDSFKYKYYWSYFGKNGTTVMSETAEIPLRNNYWDCSAKIGDAKPSTDSPIIMPKIGADEFIMGEKFEDLCDVNCEKDADYEKTIQNSKEQVLTVFSQAHELKHQMPILRTLTDKKIIMVTHNSDGELGYDGFRRWDGYKWGNESNICHWFSENADIQEPNVTPIPMGVENEHTYKITTAKLQAMTELNGSDIPKENKLLLCFNRGTNREQRNSAYEIFKDCSWVTCQEGFNNVRLVKPYFDQMIRHQFILSPDGNGFDCIRTWEALYMGCIPIVNRHVFTEYFAQYLPIIVVDNYEEISMDWLMDKMHNMKLVPYNYEMLKISYWRERIAKMKATVC